MILLVHLLFGAVIGSYIKNIPLAIILAFLGHYFLDFFPHIEYDVASIREKQWRKAMPDILKVLLDFLLGILLVFLFSKNQPIIYFCAFSAILPDGLDFLNNLFPNKILDAEKKFHKKIHFLENKKISMFWRISSQTVIVIISIILLKV